MWYGSIPFVAQNLLGICEVADSRKKLFSTIF